MKKKFVVLLFSCLVTNLYSMGDQNSMNGQKYPENSSLLNSSSSSSLSSVIQIPHSESPPLSPKNAYILSSQEQPDESFIQAQETTIEISHEQQLYVRNNTVMESCGGLGCCLFIVAIIYVIINSS